MRTYLLSLFGTLIFFSSTISVAQPTLITSPPLNGGNSAAGISFNLHSKAGIILQEVWGSMTNSSQTVQVWYNTDSISGPPTINTANGWVSLGTATYTGLSSSSASVTLSLIPISMNLVIPPGATYGFFIGSTASIPYSNSTTGSIAPGLQFFFEDNFIHINTGLSVGYGGPAPNPTNHPRLFNGGVKYLPLSRSPNDAALTAITAPGTFCGGLEDVAVRIQNFGTSTLTSAQINWTVNGITQIPFNYFGALDTIGGTGSNDTVLTIGQFNFLANTNYDIVAWTSFPNGAIDTINNNDTSTRTLRSSLAGNLTVGGIGADFSSLQALATALSNFGVCAPVTVTVDSTAGPYTGQVNFASIAGASSTNTITIEGNGAVIQHTPVTTDIAIIKLDGVSYMTLRNLSIINQATSTGTGILLTNNSNFNTIENCLIDISSNISLVSTSSGIAFSGSINSAITAGASGSFDTIRNNRIIGSAGGGPYYGITLYGNTGGLGCTGNVVENNEIRDFGFYGIAMSNSTNNRITGNNIHKPTRTNFTTFSGVTLFSGSSGNRVEANRIHNPAGGNLSSTSTLYGVFVSSADAPLGSENVFANNLIYNMTGNGTLYGIYNVGSDGTHFYHNTISLDNTSATAGTTRGFFQTTAASNVIFSNNLVSISRGGTGAKHAIYLGTTTSTITVNRNAYYLNAATGPQDIGFYSTSFNTLANWQTANGGAYDQNSVVADPGYANLAGNVLIPSSGSINNIGSFIPSIPLDFNSVQRDTLNPDPGAYEFTPVGNDAGAIAIEPATFCPGFTPLFVRIRNFGGQPITSVTVTLEVDGVNAGTAFFSGNLGSGGDTLISVGSFNFNANTNYDLLAYTTNPNGFTDLNTFNDSVSRLNVSPAFTGAVTVGGTGANYPNLQAFASAVSSSGICGPVTVTVDSAAGPYTGQVNFASIAGASSTNTITIEGNGAVIQHTPVTTDIAIVKLDGVSYMTLRNLSIINQATSTGTGILLTNNSNFNTIENCFIDISSNTSLVSTSIGIALSGSISSGIGAGNTGSFDTIRNNRIIGSAGGGPFHAISMYGNTGGVGCTGNVVENNILTDFHQYGVIMSNATNNLIKSNDISKPVRTSTTTFAGVFLSTACAGNRVESNRIHNPCGGNLSSTSTLYPLYLSTGSAVTSPNVLANNLIYNITGNGTLYGIYNLTSAGMHAYHNTISLDNTAATAGITRGFFQSGAATNIEFSNNLVSISRGGAGAKHAIYLGTTTSTVTANRNAYYLNAPGGSQDIGFYSTSFNTLANWQTANGGAYDQNSVEGNPSYVNLANFNLIPTAGIMNNIAAYIPSVSFDFNGVQRDTVTPDPGAYEFSPVGTDIAVLSLIGLPSRACTAGFSTDLSLVVANNGANTINSYNLSIVVSGPTPQTLNIFVSTPLNSSSTDTVLVGLLANLNAGQYSYVAYSELFGDGNLFNDTISGSFEIILSQLAPTVITPIQTVCAGSFAFLAADGTQNIAWYSDANLTTEVARGDSVQIGPITGNSTYYVANDAGFTESAARSTYTATPNTTGNDWGLIFNVISSPITIKTVDVYAVGAAGTISVRLTDSQGSTLATAGPFSYPGGGSTASPITVTLPINLSVPVGTGYRLLSTAFSGGALIRETSGIPFPFVSQSGNVVVTSGFISGVSQTYYWFYNWQVSSASGCPGVDSVSVLTGNIQPSPAFTFLVDESTVTFKNLTNSGATYNWTFGDGGTSTATNPTHNYASTGFYTVTLSATNACGGPTQISDFVNIVTLGLEEDALAFQELSIFPIPAKDRLTVVHPIADNNTSILVIDSKGVTVLQLSIPKDIQSTELTINKLPRGLYMILYNSDKGQFKRKVLLH